VVVRASKTILLLAIVMLSASVFEVIASKRDMTGFEDDWEEMAAEVNEGELSILKPRTDLPEHHHHSRLKITQGSLVTGWVDMYQCHTNLDITPALQIVFAPGRVRDLHITSQRKIARVWVEKNTVQLEDISPGSRICLSLKTRALSIKGKKVVLKNGPFMRRFLDGYYPMRVSMQVDYPADKIRYVDITPEGVARFVNNSSGQLEMDVRFEGRLNTEINFEQVKFEGQ
jgi:hypothetical protein